VKNRKRVPHNLQPKNFKVEIPTIFVVGPNGCGKSTFLEFLRKLAAELRSFIIADTSGIIQHFRDKEPQSKIGQFFSTPDMIDQQRRGELLPSKPVLKAQIAYLNRQVKELAGRQPQIAVIGGGVRNKMQAQRAFRKFALPHMIYIDCSEEQSLNGSLERPKDNRLEAASEEMITKRRKIAINHGVEARDYFKSKAKDRLLLLDRSDRMKDKLLEAVDFFPVPETLRIRWAECIKSTNHPVGLAVDMLDQPEKYAEQKVAGAHAVHFDSPCYKEPSIARPSPIQPFAQLPGVQASPA